MTRIPTRPPAVAATTAIRASVSARARTALPIPASRTPGALRWLVGGQAEHDERERDEAAEQREEPEILGARPAPRRRSRASPSGLILAAAATAATSPRIPTVADSRAVVPGQEGRGGGPVRDREEREDRHRPADGSGGRRARTGGPAEMACRRPRRALVIDGHEVAAGLASAADDDRDGPADARDQAAGHQLLEVRRRPAQADSDEESAEEQQHRPDPEPVDVPARDDRRRRQDADGEPGRGRLGRAQRRRAEAVRPVADDRARDGRERLHRASRDGSRPSGGPGRGSRSRSAARRAAPRRSAPRTAADRAADPRRAPPPGARRGDRAATRGPRGPTPPRPPPR